MNKNLITGYDLNTDECDARKGNPTPSQFDCFQAFNEHMASKPSKNNTSIHDESETQWMYDIRKDEITEDELVETNL